jgi:type IV pilus assembly protein PilN
MRITLNLSTRPYSDIGPAIKRLRIAIGISAVLALGLGLGVFFLHQKAEAARASEQQVQNRIDAIYKERQGYQVLMRRPANAAVLAQAVALNQLFDEKAFSWTLAMEDLETVLPGGVQVSTLEPVRDKNGLITLHLHVIGPHDHAVELVRNLERSKRFLLPRIVGENFESSGGPGEKLEPVSFSNRVNFEVLADYNPTAPTESSNSKEKLEQKPEKAEEAPTEMTRNQLHSQRNTIQAFAVHPPAIRAAAGTSLNPNPKKPNHYPNEGGQR